MARWLRGIVLLGGLALTGYGVYGFLNDPYITAPWDVLVWAGGGLVLHDGFWVPLSCLVGASVARGPVLRGWLVVAAAVTAVGLPAVLHAGEDHGNPTVLPLPYLRNWLLVLGATGRSHCWSRWPGGGAAGGRRRAGARPGGPRPRE
ncbi:hypothetical protein ACFQ0M_49615 [Kitasatospora aburaviensis]